MNLEIPDGMVERILREEVAARLPADGDLRRMRLELALTVATVSSEEGGALLGVSPRRFRELATGAGVPAMPFGHRTVRYRIVDVSLKLDSMAVAARKDLEVARGAMLAEVQRLSSVLEKLAA